MGTMVFHIVINHQFSPLAAYSFSWKLVAKNLVLDQDINFFLICSSVLTTCLLDIVLML